MSKPPSWVWVRSQGEAQNQHLLSTTTIAQEQLCFAPPLHRRWALARHRVCEGEGTGESMSKLPSWVWVNEVTGRATIYLAPPALHRSSFAPLLCTIIAPLFTLWTLVGHRVCEGEDRGENVSKSPSWSLVRSHRESSLALHRHSWRW